MKIETTPIEGLLLITPRRFGDDRGYFSESWNRATLEENGIELPEFVQDNHSVSQYAGTVRGLHYQAPPMAQGKLVRCGHGALFDVAVDARVGSPSYGQWFGATLSAQNGLQLWIPTGFLHGFVTRLPDTEIVYKCTAPYSPDHDGAVKWDSVAIGWDVTSPLLSTKDQLAPPFVAWTSPFAWED